jgi:hypothetical protein
MLALAGVVRTPTWANSPAINSTGAVLPILSVALEPVAGFLTRAAVLLSLLTGVTQATAGWTRRRALGVAIIAGVGFLGVGAPAGSSMVGWAIAGLILAVGLAVVSTTLFRADLTMIPVALGTMMALTALMRGAQRAFPGALPGSIIAAALTLLLAWWLFGALRKAMTAAVRSS